MLLGLERAGGIGLDLAKACPPSQMSNERFTASKGSMCGFFICAAQTYVVIARDYHSTRSVTQRLTTSPSSIGRRRGFVLHFRDLKWMCLIGAGGRRKEIQS